MKIITTFICLVLSLNLIAQYSPEEIVKYKIKKIIKISTNTDSSEIQKQEKLHDRNGNDTATYLEVGLVIYYQDYLAAAAAHVDLPAG